MEIDPKLSWALRHPEQFPVDVNKVDYEMLLRVPGIGVKSARLIVASRRFSKIGFYQLKKIGGDEEGAVFHYLLRVADVHGQ